MTEANGRTTYSLQATSRRVRDVPSRERPRELLDRAGAENVSDTVLLAIILRSGVQGVSVIELAQFLLAHYGSLTALSQASVDELSGVKGMGRVKAQVLKSALELSKRLIEEAAPEQHRIDTPEQAATVLRERARSREEEVFWVLPLDTKNRLKRWPIEVTRGLIDASLVHPREVFREAIRAASAAVIVAHNHPSGDPTPSAEDIRITRQIVEAGKIVDIPVLDHIVLGHRSTECETDFFSLREAGLVKFEV